MTGLTALSLILVKRPVDETLVGSIILVRFALNSGVVFVAEGRIASLHTVFSSVGFTLLAIELRLAKMARIASERFVFSPILLANSAFCLKFVLVGP